MRRYSLPLVAIALAASAAYAQDSGVIDRLSRLERDVTFLQRQVYQGKGGTVDGMPMDSGGSAQVLNRITAMEEEMRRLRGQIEQQQYQINTAAEQQKRFMADLEMRLRDIETRQMQAAAAPPAEAMPPEELMPAEENTVPSSYKPSVDQPNAPAPTGADFPNSNEHYNHAYKLVSNKDYSAAATSFDEFVRQYPKDPLVSNAYYWLGESYYARGDYTRAAEGFRKGFEANPSGQKAPDNLLKLALSLSNIKRVNEACIVLGQVSSKYASSAPRTAERAADERARLQCK